MEAIVITAAIRCFMWGTLMVAATWKRYPAFAIMGGLGVIANGLLGAAPLVSSSALAQHLREASGSFGVVLIALCVWYAFKGMAVRDKLRHPLTRRDLHL
jgi:hypothetical protein